MVSEARIKGWEKRRAKYGPAGQPPYERRPGRTGPRPKPSDLITDAQYLEKLKSLCTVMPSGCWEYQGFRYYPPRHYGGMSYRCKNWRTHRLMWHLTKGPIPTGMVVMHSCDNPPCCNPDHLSLGTHLQNMAECRAKNRYHYANLTHCKHGHEFTPENTYYIKTPGPAFGLRACKVCMKERPRTPEAKARAKERRRLKRLRLKQQTPPGSTVGADGP